MSRTKQILNFSRSLTRRHLALRSQSTLAPVFIVGSGRSGNTLIRRVLMASKQIYIPPETYVLGQIISNFKRLSYLPWQTQFHLTLGTIAASQDFKYFPKCDYHSLALSLAQSSERQKTCADLLDALYKEWSASAGMEVARWGDKTPINAFCLHEIKHTFPDAQFIYTQRSIHDMVASCIEMGRYATASEAAERWLSSNTKLLEFRAKNRDNVFTVRYEDMVSQPTSYFSSLFEFLNLNFEAEILDTPAESIPMGDHNVSHYKMVKKRISQDSINSGKRRLSQEDVREIDEFLDNRTIPADLFELI